MNSLLGVGEVLAGAIVFATGALLALVNPAGQAKTVRLAIVPLAGLMLMLLGAGILLRGLGIV
jgi:hypothetical protein